MADNDLIITLTLDDKASKEAIAALKSVGIEADSVKQKGTEAAKSIHDQFKEAGRGIKDFRQTILLATVALGSIIATTREAAKYNADAKKTFDAFTTSITALSATVGTALSPALKGVTALINFLRDSVEAVLAGFVKMFSFIFESFGAVASGMQNLAANIKNIFTGKEDPMGIVEGFRDSFRKAMDIANEASDIFLQNLESTRANVEGGITLQSIVVQNKAVGDSAKDAAEKTRLGWAAGKKSITDFGAALEGASVLSKSFAKAAAVVAIGMAIVNTAQGITAALAGPPTGPPWPFNLAMAALVGATGALQIATISAQSFAVGTPSIPNDMLAQVHKGETIIPATFADAIRKGDLSLSGGSGAGSGDIQINLYGITINSKDSIRELAEELGFEIDRNLRNARARV